MRFRNVFAAVCCLFIALSGGDALASGDQACFERVAQKLVESMRAQHIPGAALGIVHGDFTGVRGFGVTNLDHPLEVTPDTLFQIGSISKTYTATLVMRLVEEGKIHLEAPVRKYLPDFRVADEPTSANVRVIDLLTHTSGWFGDLFQDTGDGDDALHRMIERIHDLEQVTPLRSQWSYCNSGFYVAGRIVEVVTNKTFEQAMRDLVLEPIGLKHTFLLPEEVMVHRFAVGHKGEGAQLAVAQPWALARAAAPAGSVTCSIRDLLRYARFHMGDGRNAEGERVLSAQGLHRLREPSALPVRLPSNPWFYVPAVDGPRLPAEQMGITWFLGNVGPHWYMHHGGATNGQYCFLWIVPERQFAVAISSNGAGGRKFQRQVVQAAITEYLGVALESPSPLEQQPDLAQYVGTYGNPFNDLEVRLEGNALQVRSVPKRGFPDEKAKVPPPTEWMPVTFIADDVALMTSGPYQDSAVEFRRDQMGRIVFAYSGLRLHRKQATATNGDVAGQDGR